MVSVVSAVCVLWFRVHPQHSSTLLTYSHIAIVFAKRTHHKSWPTQQDCQQKAVKTYWAETNALPILDYVTE